MEQEATEQICSLLVSPAEKVAAPHLIGAREQTSFPCPELEYSSPTRVRYCSGNVETWAAFAFFLPFETCRVLFGMPLAVSDGLSDSDLAFLPTTPPGTNREAPPPPNADGGGGRAVFIDRIRSGRELFSGGLWHNFYSFAPSENQF
jgi:hypothetical protein